MSDAPVLPGDERREAAAAPVPLDSRSSLTGEELQRVAYRAILLAAALFVMYQLAAPLTTLLLFFLLVFILAAVLNPIVSRLHRRGLPRALVALGLVLMFLAFLTLLGWLALPPLLRELSAFFTRLTNNPAQLTNAYEELLRRYPQLARQIPDPGTIIQQLAQTLAPLISRVGRHTVTLAVGLLSLLLLVMLVIFTLAQPGPLIAGLLSAVPDEYRDRSVSALRRVLQALKSWALSSLIMGLIVGTMVGIGLHLLGVPQALLFGVIAGVGEVVPNIGPILSAIPPMLMTLTVSPLLAVWVALLFVAIHQLEGNLIVPLVMGERLHLHPVSVVFTILMMGTLFGLLGAILAVPVCAIVKVCWEELYLVPRKIDAQALQAVANDIVSDRIPPRDTAAGKPPRNTLGRGAGDDDRGCRESAGGSSP